jgi:glutamyl-tRNA synthetase
MNGEYIRNKLNEDELTEKLKPFVPKEWMDDLEYFKRVLQLDVERMKRLDEAQYLMEIFFVTPQVDKTLLCKKDKESDIKDWLIAAADELNQLEEFGHDDIERVLRALTETLEIKTGNLFYALRVALTGRTEAPGLFDIVATLGRDEAIKRLQNAL